MNPIFEKSKWIWCAACDGADCYAEFCDSFLYQGGSATMRISVDTDYALWVNGTYAASGQYGDFEHYKVFDTIDLTPFLQEGENRLEILVYHCGVATSRYCPAKAGLIYEVASDGKTLCKSGTGVLSRKSPNYRSGQCLPVSGQLGFTFAYDASASRDADFAESILVDKQCSFFPRPIEKHRVKPRCESRVLLEENGTHFLLDLGGETVGFPALELISGTKQTVTVAWGEHLEDGCVRKQIGTRNFYYTYRTETGHNVFTNYMLRLGCRYLEVFAEEPINLIYCGVLPQVYLIDEKPCRISDATDRRIYDICVNTLRACMMEHYVDCPWREQALYAFDSRNQMLCGYYAFENKNASYARANLSLIGQDRREGGLLSICAPSGGTMAIPSFSLYYVIAVCEYVRHTGDTTLATELIEKLQSVLKAFLANAENGLIRCFEGKGFWNFYDWSEYLSGKSGENETFAPDLMINCLFVMALDAYAQLCGYAKVENSYTGLANSMRENIRGAFKTEKGVYRMRADLEAYTELGNAMAIVSGVADGDEAIALCDKLVLREFLPSSLSMKVWTYDALMQTDAQKYKPYIIGEIRKSYGVMLAAGSDTVWETLDGASAFHNAGSLCHGWSAVPIYIYHRLGIAFRDEEQKPLENVKLSDAYGNPSDMVFIPRFLLSDVIDGADSVVHPAFIKDGKILDGIYVSKYQNVLENGVACSLPDRDPAVCVDFEEACAACAKKGDGWHMMTAEEWGAVALLCQKNGFLPLGNNDGGKDIRESCYQARITYRNEEKGAVRTATGTGPCEWFHDRTPNGIADLNGNVWEWMNDIRLVFGEIQFFSDGEWHAMNARSGEWMLPDGTGTTPDSLKLDFCMDAWVWTAKPISDMYAKPRHCAFSCVRADESVGASVKQYLQALGCLPANPANDYGGVSFYANNAKPERMLFRGGRYGQGYDAGVFKNCFDDARTAKGEMIGFRSVYYNIQ